MFKPNSIGASTLAAMAVPPEKLESIANIVNRYEQVNHNYEREHRYNLWFVATAADKAGLSAALNQIEVEAGYAVLALPLVKDYHIDLGFRMQLAGRDSLVEMHKDEETFKGDKSAGTLLANPEDLIAVIQDGLPLVSRPYQKIADQLGCSEQSVIDKLSGMLDAGIIKRLGVVVRHHELGYRANAMVVWDVPDEQVDSLGHQLGNEECVTLCYQRPRRLPDWPYNLFCMVHGQDRAEVLECIARIAEKLELQDISHTVLFSGRRFKQRGAKYRLAS